MKLIMLPFLFFQKVMLTKDKQNGTLLRQRCLKKNNERSMHKLDDN